MYVCGRAWNRYAELEVYHTESTSAVLSSGFDIIT